MSRFVQIGNELNLAFGDNLNANFDKVDSEFTRIESEMDAADANLQTQINTELQVRSAADAAHAVSSTAHDAENITFTTGTSGIVATKAGSAIKEVNTRVNNIIAGAPSSAAEVIDARTGADLVARASLGTMVREIHAKLLAAAIQSTVIKHGWNYILTDQSSPLNVIVFGKTLVNLLGRDGNFEVIPTFNQATATATVSIDTTNKVYGVCSLNITGVTGSAARGLSVVGRLVVGRKYILIADVKISSGTVSWINIQIRKTGGLSTGSKNSTIVNTTTFSPTILKFTAEADDEFACFGFSAETTGHSANIDGLRLYEISQAEYDVIDSMTAAQVSGKYPYVDSVKHLSGIGIQMNGKNINTPFTEWTNLNASANVTDPYSMTQTFVAGTLAQSWTSYDIVAGQSYVITLSNPSGGRVSGFWRDINGTNIGYITEFSSNLSTVLTAPTNSVKLQIGLDNNNLAGTRTFSNLMLRLDTVASTGVFESRNDDYLFIPNTMASNVDGTVRDEVYYRDGEWRKLKRWKVDLVLDGSLAWNWNNNGIGSKQVSVLISNAGSSPDGSLVKYDGKILVRDMVSSPLTNIGADRFNYGASSGGTVWISVADPDSGWGENYTPTANDIKAYFYGWKMYDTSGGITSSSTYTRTDGLNKGWAYRLVNGTYAGGTGTLPTGLSTSFNDGTFQPYKLSYQLATSVEEVILAEGSIGLHAGGNQMELFEGVIIREKASPAVSTGIGLINDTGVPTSQLKLKTDRIIAIYKNGVRDTSWIITTNNAYGKQRAFNPSNYDATAEYTVTYNALDRYGLTVNATDASGTYNTNLKTVVDEVVKHLADLETAVMVNSNTIAAQPRRQVGEATGTIVTPGTAVTINGTFPRAYAVAPNIRLTLKSSAGGTAGYINLAAENITTTGFTLRVNAYVAGTIVVGWEAVG